MVNLHIGDVVLLVDGEYRIVTKFGNDDVIAGTAHTYYLRDYRQSIYKTDYSKNIIQVWRAKEPAGLAQVLDNLSLEPDEEFWTKLWSAVPTEVTWNTDGSIEVDGTTYVPKREPPFPEPPYPYCPD